jgi:hypothetical protein
MAETHLNDRSAEAVQIGLNGNGCGHKIFMGVKHKRVCLDEHRPWFCTICGKQRVYVGETLADKLRRERDAALQREETIRQQRDEAKATIAKERRSKARLKKRIKAGVCPCCNRTVSQMARHMKTKHPDYASIKDGEHS